MEPPAPPVTAEAARRAKALATPLAKAPHPLPFFFELHRDPIFDHPLWIERTETVPGARIDCSTRSRPDGVQDARPAAGPADTVYAFVTRVIRYLEKFGPHMGPRNRPFNWFALPAQFGGFGIKSANIKPLFRNPEDFLARGKWGIFSRRGIEWNRAWSEEMLPHLADELKRQRLPDPLMFTLVSENGPVGDYEGHLGKPDRGWYPEALADKRADDPNELIDGTRTLRQYHEDARALDGSPVPEFVHEDYSPRSSHLPRNADNTDEYWGAMRLMWDWCRERSFNQVARAAFVRDPADPGKTVKTSEYLAACDSKWAPIRRYPKAFMHQMDGIFHTDLQSPGYYRDKPYFLDEATFTPKGPEWPTRTNWAKVYKVEGRTNEEIEIRLGMEYAKESATNHARSAPHRPLAPWVGERSGLTIDEAVEYIEHCRALGAWCIHVFSPLPDRAHHDYWFQVVSRVNGA